MCRTNDNSTVFTTNPKLDNMLDPNSLTDLELHDRIQDIRSALNEGNLTEEQQTEYRVHLNDLTNEQDNRYTDQRFQFISTNRRPL